jgi:hypothetical protein
VKLPALGGSVVTVRRMDTDGMEVDENVGTSPM